MGQEFEQLEMGCFGHKLEGNVLITEMGGAGLDQLGKQL